MRRAMTAFAALALLVACGGEPAPSGAEPAPAPSLAPLEIAKWCAMPTERQRLLMRENALPLLPAAWRDQAKFLDDCETAVDAAYAWFSGVGVEPTIKPFLDAGWARAVPVTDEGWSHAVVGDAGGHRFRVDLGCDSPPDEAPVLPSPVPSPPGCFSQMRVLR